MGGYYSMKKKLMQSKNVDKDKVFLYKDIQHFFFEYCKYCTDYKSDLGLVALYRKYLIP